MSELVGGVRVGSGFGVCVKEFAEKLDGVVAAVVFEGVCSHEVRMEVVLCLVVAVGVVVGRLLERLFS